MTSSAFERPLQRGADHLRGQLQWRDCSHCCRLDNARPVSFDHRHELWCRPRDALPLVTIIGMDGDKSLVDLTGQEGSQGGFGEPA